jgi:esterase/lipase superfamily enzyme
MPLPKFWMITNRNRKDNTLGRNRAELSFWVSSGGPINTLGNWKFTTKDRFQKLLLGATDEFPVVTDPAQNEKQKHVTLFVHGFNTDWNEAAERYQTICEQLYSGDESLGICILFTWPSDGSPMNYLPDRADAREAGLDLADVLSDFFDWLIVKQSDAVESPKKACQAKTSLIAHSMGNFVTQKAMQLCWTRKNQPLLVSLINQMVMVAADVDNDLFRCGEASDKTDGDAIANLTYRVSALYTGRDSVLGMSAGLKHFGKRRLGRSGIDRTCPRPDNVWDVDCTRLIPENADAVHSAYFYSSPTIELMRRVLRGEDRNIIERAFEGSLPPK